MELFNARALSHAYIISGHAGNRRETLTLRIASAMVCKSDYDKPCGVCPHCEKAAKNIHPDIITVDREQDSREIYIDQMRAVRADAAILPNEAEKKVYIIKNADTMNTKAQNAMLKTLEEPPSHAAFILIVENAGALLPTVRSRCTEISLAPDENCYGSISDSAGEFVETVIAGGKERLMEQIFSLEHYDKNDLSDYLLEVSRAASQRLRNAEGTERARLIKLLRTIAATDEYAAFNVGSGHIAGLIMSELL